MKTQTKLNEVLKDSSFEDYSLEDYETAEEVIEAIQEEIYNEEIIYYSKAMDYLHENDNSLTNSIGLAIEQGCSMENLNSELLASLLLQQNLNEELYELSNEIRGAFDDTFFDWDK